MRPTLAVMTVLGLCALLGLSACKTPPRHGADLQLAAGAGAHAQATGNGQFFVRNAGPGYVDVAWSPDPARLPAESEWTELPAMAETARTANGRLWAYVRARDVFTEVAFLVVPGVAVTMKPGLPEASDGE